MKIIEADNKEKYNKFVLDNEGSLEQSWDWGMLQESYEREVKRVMIYRGDEAVAAASFVKQKLKFGKEYWLCPGGPLLRQGFGGQAVFAELAKKLSGVFIRIEPRLLAASRKQLVASGFVEAPKDHSPRATVRVDLSKPEEEILSAMHQKTRYNIRLAQRKGVSVEEVKEGIESFLDLLRKTSSRDGFGIHKDSHYENLVKMAGVHLYMAKYKGKPVAGAIVSVFGTEAAYLHGASDHEFRSVMAPYFLHYRIMKNVRENGAKVYDLRGVAPEGSHNHPWAGITRFKKGFGGEYIEYVGTHDFVFDKFWYFVYKLGRKLL